VAPLPDTVDALIDSALDVTPQNTGKPHDDNSTIAFQSQETFVDYDPRPLTVEPALPELHDGRDELDHFSRIIYSPSPRPLPQ